MSDRPMAKRRTLYVVAEDAAMVEYHVMEGSRGGSVFENRQKAQDVAVLGVQKRVFEFTYVIKLVADSAERP